MLEYDRKYAHITYPIFDSDYYGLVDDTLANEVDCIVSDDIIVVTAWLPGNHDLLLRAFFDSDVVRSIGSAWVQI